jgi:hypothetical protein
MPDYVRCVKVLGLYFFLDFGEWILTEPLTVPSPTL